MGSLDEFAKKIASLKSLLHERYAVSKIEVFGSYVRGEQHKNSDLDILVEYDKAVDLLDLVSLEMYLGEQLGVRVDVVPKRSIRPELRAEIINEAITL